MPSASSPPISWGRSLAARRQHRIAGADVLADLDHVLALGGRRHDLDAALGAAAVDPLRVLDHHDRVGVLRDHAAGVDQRGLADAQFDGADLAHGHFADDGEKGRQARRGAVGVAGVDCVTVDGGTAEVGQILPRDAAVSASTRSSASSVRMRSVFTTG